MVILRESDKHFILSLFAATGIIMFWRGLWEIMADVPILEDPLVDLVAGLTLLAFSGILFKEFDPTGGIENSSINMIHTVNHHPKRHEFSIKYYDKAKKQEIEISAKHIKSIEKNNLLVHSKGKEQFIPIHRIRSIHRKGVVVWRA